MRTSTCRSSTPTASRRSRAPVPPGVETMLIVGGVDAEAGHRRAVTVAEHWACPPPPASIPTKRGWPRPRPTTSCAGSPATSGSSPSGRSASTSTTTTRRATSSAKSSGRRSAWPGMSPCPSSSIPARPTTRRRRCSRKRRRRRGRHPLLHRWPRPGAPGPRPRLLHLVLGDPGLPEVGGHPGSRADDAPRPPAGRNGLPVPGSAAPSGQAERARLRGGGGPEGGRAARHAGRRSGPRRRRQLPRGCSALQRD